MGSSCFKACDSSTEIVVEGMFDMPGVPPAIAQEVIFDIQAAPSFHPLILSVEKVRGEPCEVGFCWLERLRVTTDSSWEVVFRKTITKQSDDHDPIFSQSGHIELVKTNSCTTPDFISTYTQSIHPSEEGCAIIQWRDAIVSRGLLGRVLSVCCVPCLRRVWVAQSQDEWNYYYQEALRRTQTMPFKEDIRG